MEYVKAERIVKFYNEIDEEIKVQMKFIKDIDDTYYSTVGAQIINGMPSGKNKKMNPTELRAINIPEDIHRDYMNYQKRLRDLCACRSAILQEINKLNIREKQIIIAFYFEGRKWEQIKAQLHYSIRQCKNIRRHAIYILSHNFDENPIIKNFFDDYPEFLVKR
ncbi:MAG: hypothetical protein ACI4A5_11095 [Hominilimicola sp.]